MLGAFQRNYVMRRSLRPSAFQSTVATADVRDVVSQAYKTGRVLGGRSPARPDNSVLLTSLISPPENLLDLRVC